MANNADDTAPVEHEPKDGKLHARYGNGVKLILRNDGWSRRWAPARAIRRRNGLGRNWRQRRNRGELECAARRRGAKIAGYPAIFHVRNFLTA